MLAWTKSLNLEDMSVRLWSLVLPFLGFIWLGHSWASLEPSRIFQAQGKKIEKYISDGLIVGGEPTVLAAEVQDIRRSANDKYERIVIDLIDSRSSGLTPYYQVSVNPEEKRLIYTVWAKPQSAFQISKVKTAMKKSRAVESVELLPMVEADRWSFVLNLKLDGPVEVFDLSNPGRIITDIRLRRSLPK